MILDKKYAVVLGIVAAILFLLLGWVLWRINSLLTFEERMTTIEKKSDADGKVLYDVVRYLQSQQNQLPR